MCSAVGGTIQIHPASPDTEIPHSSFLIPNYQRGGGFAGTPMIEQNIPFCTNLTLCTKKEAQKNHLYPFPTKYR